MDIDKRFVWPNSHKGIASPRWSADSQLGPRHCVAPACTPDRYHGQVGARRRRHQPYPYAARPPPNIIRHGGKAARAAAIVMHELDVADGERPTWTSPRINERFEGQPLQLRT